MNAVSASRSGCESGSGACVWRISRIAAVWSAGSATGLKPPGGDQFVGGQVENPRHEADYRRRVWHENPTFQVEQHLHSDENHLSHNQFRVAAGDLTNR